MSDAEPLLAPVDWREVAVLLAEELERWGWGDMHYAVGSKQDARVRAILDFYRKAQMQHHRWMRQQEVPRGTPSLLVAGECAVCGGSGIAGVANGHEYPCLLCRPQTVDNPVDAPTGQSTPRQPTESETHP